MDQQATGGPHSYRTGRSLRNPRSRQNTGLQHYIAPLPRPRARGCPPARPCKIYNMSPFLLPSPPPKYSSLRPSYLRSSTITGLTDHSPCFFCFHLPIMKFTTTVLTAALAASSGVLAAPTATCTLDKRSTTISCDSWGSLETGGYTIYHNNWGASEATSGSQCTYFDSLSGTTVAWHTSWTWAGGSSNVKSYSNVAVEDVNKQLSAVSSIPSTWKWR